MSVQVAGVKWQVALRVANFQVKVDWHLIHSYINTCKILIVKHDFKRKSSSIRCLFQ